MIAVDTNILIYSYRKESSFFAKAFQCLSHLAEGKRPWGLPIFCIGEFIRVVTHPKVFRIPSKTDSVFKSLDSLFQSPSIRILNPGENFPKLLEKQVKEAHVSGNLIFDAQIVAVCLEHGVDRLLTQDQDFARFPSIRTLSLNDTLPL